MEGQDVHPRQRGEDVTDSSAEQGLEAGRLPDRRCLRHFGNEAPRVAEGRCSREWHVYTLFALFRDGRTARAHGGATLRECEVPNPLRRGKAPDDRRPDVEGRPRANRSIGPGERGFRQTIFGWTRTGRTDLHAVTRGGRSIGRVRSRALCPDDRPPGGWRSMRPPFGTSAETPARGDWTVAPAKGAVRQALGPAGRNRTPILRQGGGSPRPRRTSSAPLAGRPDLGSDRTPSGARDTRTKGHEHGADQTMTARGQGPR